MSHPGPVGPTATPQDAAAPPLRVAFLLAAADATVCAVIGDGTRERAGFSTLRCSDGLVADLEAHERAANPDGRERASNPTMWSGTAVTAGM
jgi:hypothetical protein